MTRSLPRTGGARRLRLLVPLVAALALVLPPAGAALRPEAGPSGSTSSTRGASAQIPKIRHVFVINIENKDYDKTWGTDSAAPYLAEKLRKQGVLLNQYYGTAHLSQGNYIAQISGQGPNLDMQSDCRHYPTFVQVGKQAPGQALGRGCVFPENVKSLPRQLTDHHLRWKGYLEDMTRSCQHPRRDTRDNTQQATDTDYYAARHNPFVYFSSITGHPKYCRKHVVKLSALRHDLRRSSHTPNLAYITPDLCNDGHDSDCGDGRPGGLRSVNAFMKRWVPRILHSPAFRKNGVLIITSDESDGPQSDATACCGEGASANSPLPGIVGPGGGRIGALVLSKFVKPNTSNSTPYNHYSLLASMEEIFGLRKLGYARADGVKPFGLDVYNSGWNE